MKLGQLLKNKYVLYAVLFLAITNVLGYLTIGDYKSLTMFVIIGVLSTYFSKNMIINLGSAIIFTNLFFAKNMIEGFSHGQSAGNVDDGKDMKDMKKEEKKPEEEVVEVDVDVEVTEKPAEKSATGAGASPPAPPRDKVAEKPAEKPADKAAAEPKAANDVLYALGEDEKCNPVKECPEGSTCFSDPGCKTKIGGFTQRNVPSSQPAPASEEMEDKEIGKRVDYASTLEQAYDNLQNVLGGKGMDGLTKETQKLISQQSSLMKTLNTMSPVLNNAKSTLEKFNIGNITESLSTLKGLMGKGGSK